MKLKRLINICLNILIIVSLISNMHINIYAEGYFQGNGQLTGAQPIVNRIYNIKSYMDTNRYFDVVNGATTNRSNVWTYPYNGAACQEWKITKVEGTDEYVIQDINSGKYLSIEASSSAIGANAWIWEYDGTTGQRFKIEQHYNASGNATPYYKILTKSSGYALALGVDTSTHNISQINKDSPYAIMALEEASFAKGIPDGYNYIQNKYYNSVDRGFLTIDASDGKLLLSSFNPIYSRFNFVYLGNNYYKIMIGDSLCLTVTNSLYNNKNIVAYATYTGSSTQHWKISSEGKYFKFQPQCGENNNDFLFSEYIIDEFYNVYVNGNIVLDNSTSNSTRSYWRVINSDDFLEQIGAYLCGVNDSRHNLNHIDWIEGAMIKLYEKENTTIKYNQIKVGYGYNESIDFNTFAAGLSASTLMVYRGHGGYSNKSYLLLTPILTNGAYTEDTATKFYCTDMNTIDVSNVSCALFLCCNSAEGSYSNQGSNNFVTIGIENGINCVIGFDGEVSCTYASNFVNTFIELYTGVDNDDNYVAQNSHNYYEAFRQTIGSLGVENNKPFLSTASYKIYYSNGLVTEYYD